MMFEYGICVSVHVPFVEILRCSMSCLFMLSLHGAAMCTDMLMGGVG